MSKRDEYRQFATTSLELAEKTNNADKMRLLLMAEAWLDLAERTADSQSAPWAITHWSDRLLGSE